MMERFWKRPRGQFDLETELRARRAEPPPEFLHALAEHVRDSRPHLARRPLRAALAAGLTGLLLLGLASVGGFEYAIAASSKMVSAMKAPPSPTDPSPGKSQYGGKNCGNPDRLPDPFKKPCPKLKVLDTSVKEGNAGTTPATFTVSMDTPSTETVTVSYVTADGTAIAGADYIATSGMLTFLAGETTKTLTVLVVGDTLRERNETFFVNLVSVSDNAAIEDGQGQGTIVNDD